jgi:exodeoxyribonuclease-3
MKILSWNVNGLRAIVKKDFYKILKEIQADIICLQETKAQEDEIIHELKPLSEYTAFINSAEKKGYAGTATLSKIKPIQVSYGMGIKEFDTEGRIIVTEFKNFQLLNVYTPNAGQGLKRLDFKQQWNLAFIDFTKKLESYKPLIICGDLNVAHKPIDLKNYKSNYNKTAGYTQVEIDGMTAQLEAGFIDAFRHLYPEKVAYTYWSYRFKARARNTGWRIDYFLVSKKLINYVKDVQILSEYFGSDHCPILLEIEI